jgi:hypothetical protein
VSASSTSLCDYVETAKQRVPHFMHPYVYEYLGWAGYHANHDDAREVARYLKLARGPTALSRCYRRTTNQRLAHIRH